MIKWNHIMDKQPDDRTSIVQVNRPYEGHYMICMRDYYQECCFDEVLKFCRENEQDYPDFWWVYSKDFPFPVEDLK